MRLQYALPAVAVVLLIAGYVLLRSPSTDAVTMDAYGTGIFLPHIDGYTLRPENSKNTPVPGYSPRYIYLSDAAAALYKGYKSDAEREAHKDEILQHPQLWVLSDHADVKYDEQTFAMNAKVLMSMVRNGEAGVIPPDTNVDASKKCIFMSKYEVEDKMVAAHAMCRIRSRVVAFMYVKGFLHKPEDIEITMTQKAGNDLIERIVDANER